MKLLQIDSSPMGESAITRRLTSEFARSWLAANPGSKVITRSLAETVIPIITGEWVSANYTRKESRTERQHKVLRLSAGLIAEMTDADEYVLGIPIHNWGPPSCFKLWVDQIVTPATLAERPLAGKGLTAMIAAGRVYAPGSPDASKNYLVPWLRTLFGTLGMADMKFVIADGTKCAQNGEIKRAEFLAPYLQTIHSFFTQKEFTTELALKT